MLAFSGAAKSGRLPARIAAAVLGASCVAGALIGAACFVAPPPDLPNQPSGRPTILLDSVVPPADQILTSAQIPQDGMFPFVVPIEVEDPTLPFQWRVFVDYDPYAATNQAIMGVVQPTPGTVDAGVTLVQFPLPFGSGTLSTPYCHRIAFYVAYSFAFLTGNTPSPGVVADSVSWLYNGTGGPSSCPQSFDASAFGEGGLTIPDAAPDQLPVAPESGSDP
jgi:hypothetical protein